MRPARCWPRRCGVRAGLAGATVIDTIRAGSLERRRPIVLLVEAEAMAAAGDPDRADALMERVIESVGIDEAWRLRGGVPSRLAWPMPASMRPTPRRPSPTFGGPATTTAPTRRRPSGRPPPRPAGGRAAGLQRRPRGRGRPRAGPRPAARRARGGGGRDLAEPTLGPQPPPDRLLLYGDLLRAAGRTQEASEAATAPPAPEPDRLGLCPAHPAAGAASVHGTHPRPGQARRRAARPHRRSWRASSARAWSACAC